MQVTYNPNYNTNENFIEYFITINTLFTVTIVAETAFNR